MRQSVGTLTVLEIGHRPTGQTPENAAAAIAVEERSEDQTTSETVRAPPAFSSGTACFVSLDRRETSARKY